MASQGEGSRRRDREGHETDKSGRSPQRRRTVAPITDGNVTTLIEQQTRPIFRAIKELKDSHELLSHKVGNIVDRITGLESQVLLLSESIRETVRANEQSTSRPRVGAATSANGMKFLNELEHAGRTNLKNRFRDKIKKFCLSRGGRMYYGSQGCKELVTGDIASTNFLDLIFL